MENAGKVAAEYMGGLFESESITALDRAKAVQIIDQPSYDAAAEMISAVTELQRKIEDHYREPIQKAYQAHKALKAAEKRLTTPLMEAKGLLGRMIAQWDVEQEKVRLEKERIAREAARKREEEERLAMAAEAEEEGATEETVQEILETPMAVTEAVVSQPKTYQPKKNISTRQNWKWMVIDKKAIPLEYMMPNEKMINGVVRSMGANTNIPGIKAFPETSTIVRRG